MPSLKPKSKISRFKIQYLDLIDNKKGDTTNTTTHPPKTIKLDPKFDLKRSFFASCKGRYLQNSNPNNDFRLWNFVHNSFLAIDIVEIGLLGKTENRIVYTGNGIIPIV